MSFSISHIHDLLDQTFTWQVVVTNNGPNTARDVVVDIDIPVGVSYLTYTATSGAYEPSQHKYYAGNIATDTSKTITFTLRTVSVPNDDLQFTATVTALGVDSDLDNNVLQYTLPFLPLYTNQVTTVDLKIWLPSTIRQVGNSSYMYSTYAEMGLLGIESPFTGQVSDTETELSPNLFFGGDIDNSLIINQGPDLYIDWVFVWIEQNGVIRQTRSGLLKADGSIVGLDGASVLSFDVEPGDYRIALKVRGSLNFGTLKHYTFNGVPISLDLTNGSVPLRGIHKSHVVEGKHCLIMGDLTGNGIIQVVADGEPGYASSDTKVFNDNNGLFDIYLISDLNKDGSQDSIDSILLEENNGKSSF